MLILRGKAKQNLEGLIYQVWQIMSLRQINERITDMVDFLADLRGLLRRKNQEIAKKLLCEQSQKITLGLRDQRRGDYQRV